MQNEFINKVIDMNTEAREMKEFIGVDVGGTSVKLGIVDEAGNVLSRREIEHNRGIEKEDVMQVIVRGIREVAGEAGMPIQHYSGIGVSAAGCINSRTGCVARNGGNIPGWSYTEVCKVLRNEFDLPNSLANDANCAILGEFWTGAANGYTDVVGVTLGTGVGGGIISGGRLLEGSRGFGGEIGHFPTHAGGEHCVCGLDGCFERYAATSSLIRTSGRVNPEWDNGRTLFGAAAEGEPDALRIIDSWITETAYGIAGLVHIFDPQLILIGGGVSRQQDLLIEPLKAKVLSLVMPDFADGLEFKAAALGNDAGMVGAVYYLLSRANVDERI